MSESFVEKQACILAFIQESKALLEAIKRSHSTERFVLLYPRSGPVSADGKRNRSQSIARSLKGSDLRLLGLSDELLQHEHDLEEASLGRLMGTRLADCISYLERLQQRVSDRTSKILVTGDVNSGKSTFVNALLRRTLLPTDQQPCTQSFCEVVSVHKEPSDSKLCVHATTDFDSYSSNNHKTFQCVSIEEMQELIQDETTAYQLFRVFLVGAIDGFSRSLSMNISLIDSPGLNSDLFKTMSLFSKQEDIDAIVFLINAANHLTLSAREFLATAGQEKAYIFVVVNKFDEIRNQEKCKRLVLGQIQQVLPRTYEERSELVHFVSIGNFQKSLRYESRNIHSASSVESQSIDLVDDLFKAQTDFLRLEDCLRDFILEKRTKSKLLPAQTYLTHLLGELSSVLQHNSKRRGEELSRTRQELDIIAPCFDEIMAHHGLIQVDLCHAVEQIGQEIYSKSRDLLCKFEGPSPIKDIPWTGIFNVLKFRQEVESAMSRSAEACLHRVRLQATRLTLSGLHLLHATATAHAKQIFAGSSPTFDETSISSQIASFSSLSMRPSRLEAVHLIDFSLVQLAHSSTWLGATTFACAIFGYQPILTLALRVLDLSRGTGRVLSMLVVAGLGTLAVVTFLGDVESMVRSKLHHHYSLFYTSSTWTHEPARLLENGARQVLSKTQTDLVVRFEAVLHQQRQLRAEKDLLCCQTETLLGYLNEQLHITQRLLAAISQYNL